MLFPGLMKESFQVNQQSKILNNKQVSEKAVIE